MLLDNQGENMNNVLLSSILTVATGICLLGSDSTLEWSMVMGIAIGAGVAFSVTLNALSFLFKKESA